MKQWGDVAVVPLRGMKGLQPELSVSAAPTLALKVPNLVFSRTEQMNAGLDTRVFSARGRCKATCA